MAPPSNMRGVGASPVPSQTQIGPSTVSSSISRLTFAAVVWRDATESRKNDTGMISSAVTRIAGTDPSVMRSTPVNDNPRVPAISPPRPTASRIGTCGAWRRVTKFSASVNATPSPKSAPRAARGASGAAPSPLTARAMPASTSSVVIQVARGVRSP